MAIKIKYKDPKSTDFSPEDIIINIKDGSIFYKSISNDLYKIQGDNLNTETINEQTITRIKIMKYLSHGLTLQQKLIQHIHTLIIVL